MGRDTFDAVLASVPNGATAGRVASRGNHYEPNIDFGDKFHGDAPPPMRKFDPGLAKNPEFKNLTGLKVGRLTVVGLARQVSETHGALWVVRCVCGDYEYRRTRTLLKTKRPDMQMCHVCYDLQQKRLIYKTEGARPIEEFFTSVLK